MERGLLETDMDLLPGGIGLPEGVMEIQRGSMGPKIILTKP